MAFSDYDESRSDILGYVLLPGERHSYFDRDDVGVVVLATQSDWIPGLGKGFPFLASLAGAQRDGNLGYLRRIACCICNIDCCRRSFVISICSILYVTMDFI
jgi:hypothetical protein